MSGAASSSMIAGSQGFPQNAANHLPTISLFRCSFDIVLSPLPDALLQDLRMAPVRKPFAIGTADCVAEVNDKRRHSCAVPPAQSSSRIQKQESIMSVASIEWALIGRGKGSLME
jgi:hypothetical protein